LGFIGSGGAGSAFVFEYENKKYVLKIHDFKGDLNGSLFKEKVNLVMMENERYYKFISNLDQKYY
jgi:hypothetical protein